MRKRKRYGRQKKVIVSISGDEIVVDGQDYENLNKYKWRILKSWGKQYAIRYVKHRPILMHRQIMGFPESIVDHIDGNGLNNERSNLREATCSQNMMNRGPIKTSRTGFKGVSFNKQRGKYLVRIAKDGKTFFIGWFSDPTKGAKAYNKKCLLLHSEFAKVNSNVQ